MTNKVAATCMLEINRPNHQELCVVVWLIMWEFAHCVAASLKTMYESCSAVDGWPKLQWIITQMKYLSVISAQQTVLGTLDVNIVTAYQHICLIM